MFKKGDTAYRCGHYQITDEFTVLPYKVIEVVNRYDTLYLCLDDGDYGVFMTEPNSYFKTEEEALRHYISTINNEISELKEKKELLQDLLESYTEL